MPKKCDTIKCRERLMVEEFILTTKKKGETLYFSAEDVCRYSMNRGRGRPPLPVDVSHVGKALQNMRYAKAGVRRGRPIAPGARAQYAVSVNTHRCWSKNPTALLPTARGWDYFDPVQQMEMLQRKAPQPGFKQYAVKGKPMQAKLPVTTDRMADFVDNAVGGTAQPARSVRTSLTAPPTEVSEMQAEILRLRRELLELRQAAAGVMYTVTEGEYKGHPVLTFKGPGLRTPLTLGLSKLRAVEANWPYVVEFLARNPVAVTTA